jgi:hypothetical protein
MVSSIKLEILKEHFFSFGRSGVRIQGFTLARQASIALEPLHQP